MLASLAKPVTMNSNVSHPPTACVDLFVVRSVEDIVVLSFVWGGASRDPIRECSDRGLIAVLSYLPLTLLSSRNFLSTLRPQFAALSFASRDPMTVAPGGLAIFL